MIMKHAALDGCLPMGTPCPPRSITMLDPNEDPRRFLTHAELDHLLERTLTLFPEHYAFVYTAAFTVRDA